MSMTKPLLYMARKRNTYGNKSESSFLNRFLISTVLVRELKADAGPTVFFHSTKSSWFITISCKSKCWIWQNISHLLKSSKDNCWCFRAEIKKCLALLNAQFQGNVPFCWMGLQTMSVLFFDQRFISTHVSMIGRNWSYEQS